MYAPPPDPTELAAWGMTAADYEQTVEVWPENWPAVMLFDRVGTQWRSNGFDLCGLDYAALYPLLDRMNLDPVAWDDMLSDIQALESAALERSRESRNS